MNAAASLRRGACPSLPEPMQTGDGLLARLQSLAPLTLDQLAGLACLARTLGNGIVEVTARGKLQLRGLGPTSAARLPPAVDALGIEVPQGFPTEASALAGLDPAERADPRPLARAIMDAAAPLVPQLAPKASVVIDGGGALHLEALKADIGVTAIAVERWLVSLAGVPAGEAAPGQAAGRRSRFAATYGRCGPDGAHGRSRRRARRLRPGATGRPVAGLPHHCAPGSGAGGDSWIAGRQRRAGARSRLRAGKGRGAGGSRRG
ncbi:MAG: hypothetical protein DI549_22240, partial [Ancylobacter novellus]